MTANELYRSFLKALSTVYNNDEASGITSIIFEHFAGISKSSLVKDPRRKIEPAILSAIDAALIALKRNEPVQYIVGEAWFYQMKLKVSPAVLIPRPETEELAATIILSLQNSAGLQMIDIGTGSGCLAISVKKNTEKVSVTALDISAEALVIARENAKNQSAEVTFIECDFLNEQNWRQLEKYDRIVSNPPYIPLAEKNSMDKNVTLYEPHLALFVDDKRPLLFYEQIAHFAVDHLREKGMIMLETHEHLAQQVAALFNKKRYKTEIKKDMFEKERMVIVTRCQ